MLKVDVQIMPHAMIDNNVIDVAGYGAGWCLIGDVLLNIPVSMFCQIIRVNFKVGYYILNEYTK